MNIIYTDEEGDGGHPQMSENALPGSSRSGPSTAFLTSRPIPPPRRIKYLDVKKEESNNSNEVEFAYNHEPVNLYHIDDGGGDLKFTDFLKSSENSPRSGYRLIEKALVDNLSKQHIVAMRPIQVATFQAVIFANPASSVPADFLGVSSTGSGKTHAFLVPIVQKCLNQFKYIPYSTKSPPFALIFAHSNALVESIFRKLLELAEGTNLHIKCIAGGGPWLRHPYFDIGVCSIGRFTDHFSDDLPGPQIDVNALKYVVIDEADKMAQLPEFLSIFRELKKRANFATLVFSATYDSSVMSFLNEYNFFAFRHGPSNTVADSIREKYWQVNSRCVSQVYGVFREEPVVEPFEVGQNPSPFDVLYCMLNAYKKKKNSDMRVIIFVKRTSAADYIAQRLTLYGVPAVSVHSSHPPKYRDRFLQFYIDGRVHVMVTTNLLTRGTDVRCDYVFNFDLPLEHADFIHRVGRTGRNGKMGVAITCVDFNNHDDYNPEVLQQIALNAKKLPEFMVEFAENARKLRDIKDEVKQEL